MNDKLRGLYDDVHVRTTQYEYVHHGNRIDVVFPVGKWGQT